MNRRWLPLLGLLMCGCHANTPPRPAPNPTESAARAESGSLASLARQVRTAPDPQAEAAAIRRLRAWITSHGETYQIRTTRTDLNREISSASVAPGIPVRAEISVYRREELVNSFSFIPQDNRNLALLGE